MNIPILLYHSVSDHCTKLYRPWSISPLMFEQHMMYLKNHGYQPLTINDLMNSIKSGGSGLPQRPIGITFDDGLADFLDGAVPILEKHNFPATLFITTGYVGETSRWLKDLGEQDRPMLTWEQIASLAGVEIGSHSHSHFQLDIVTRKCAQDEIIRSKRLLEKHIGRPVKSFAFPHGYHTRKLLRIVRDAGYSSACVVDHQMADLQENVFSIPRIIINAGVTTLELESILNGMNLRPKSFLNPLLKFGWRMARFMKVEKLLPATDDFSSSIFLLLCLVSSLFKNLFLYECRH